MTTKRDAYLIAQGLRAHLLGLSPASKHESIEQQILESLLVFGPIDLALIQETQKKFVEVCEIFLRSAPA